MDAAGSTPARLADADNPVSLRHLLSAERPQAPNVTTPQLMSANLFHHLDAESSRPEGSRPPKAAAAMTTTTRRNKDGNISSVYSGNRIRFLKKDDGEPLWRKDIQFLFLRTVFGDQRRVFTKASDGTQGHTFAEIYIDAMAKSSKCSQILKEKLLTDQAGAIDMAMVCLLVNVGRMNTTLNFFPEMRARVRTYHSIPSLQAQQGTQAYKQLQDGPRLKSILKGATEDSPQPNNIEDLMNQPRPRTNPVNLIFVLSQYAPKISEMHFFPSRDFFDIFIRTTLTSESRAKAFLWMIWWYLESDFTAEDAMRNPFGRGLSGEDGGLPIKVPAFDMLSEEEAELENVDTPEEIAFGHAKKMEREAILSNDMPPTASAPKRGTKTALMEHQHNYRFRVSPYGSSQSGSDAGSRGRPSPSPPPRESRPEGLMVQGSRIDRDATQSPPPVLSMPAGPTEVTPVAPSVRINNLLNDEQAPTPSVSASRNPNKGVGRGNYPRKPKEPFVLPFEQVHRNPEIQPHPPIRNPSQPSINDHNELSVAPNIPHLINAPPLTPQALAPAPSSIQGYWIPIHGSSVDAPSSVVGAVTTAAGVGASGKRARNPSAYQREVERSRHERKNYLLHHNRRAMERAHRRQRRRRGNLADAWIKAQALKEGWNSEEDEPLRRWGGVDDIRVNETPDGLLGMGDAGARIGEVAKAWRKVGRSMGAGALIDRDRNLLRAKGRNGKYSLKEEEDFANEDGYSPSPEEMRSDELVAAPEESVPASKRKRRPAQRKTTGHTNDEADKSAVSASSKKRTISKVSPGSSPADGGARASKGPGKSKSTASRGGTATVPRKIMTEGKEGEHREEDMDEMDLELLADVEGHEVVEVSDGADEVEVDPDVKLMADAEMDVKSDAGRVSKAEPGPDIKAAEGGGVGTITPAPGPPIEQVEREVMMVDA